MASDFLSHLENKTYKTRYRTEFITITDDVRQAVTDSGVTRGMVVVQSHHTTCGLWINENEKNLIGPSEEIGYTSDLRKVMDRFADPTLEYGHNDICHGQNPEGKRNTHLCEPDENGVIHECINGHAHAQAMLTSPSVSVIVENGRLLLGRWQEIMLVELDHDRERTISILVQGMGK